MRLEDQQRGSSFETDPALDTDDRVAGMDIPADTYGAARLFNFLIASTGVRHGSELKPVNSPFLKCSSRRTGLVFVTLVGKASSGKALPEVRVSLPPTEVPTVLVDE